MEKSPVLNLSNKCGYVRGTPTLSESKHTVIGPHLVGFLDFITYLRLYAFGNLMFSIGWAFCHAVTPDAAVRSSEIYSFRYER